MLASRFCLFPPVVQLEPTLVFCDAGRWTPHCRIMLEVGLGHAVSELSVEVGWLASEHPLVVACISSGQPRQTLLVCERQEREKRKKKAYR